MIREYIEINDARENNLKDISLKIPKHRITVFTGVSGSGKSSLVMDTIAAQSRLSSTTLSRGSCSIICPSTAGRMWAA